MQLTEQDLAAYLAEHPEFFERHAELLAGVQLQSPVDVDTRGGRLTIAWDGGARPVLLTGPVAHVFDGTIEL